MVKFVFAAIALAIPTLATPLCGLASFADYISLGAGGCQIEDKIYSNFGYSISASPGVATPSASAVSVAPLPAPPGGFLNPGGGLSFATGGWAVAGADQWMKVQIVYAVTVAPGWPYLINDASLIVAGNTLGGATVKTTERVTSASNPANFLELSVHLPGAPAQQTILPLGPSKTVWVEKEISISTVGAKAFAFGSVSIVQQRISQTAIPEAGTFLMLGGGLLAFAAIRRPAAWLRKR